MKEFLKKLRGEVIITSVITIVLGALLLIFPEGFQRLFCIIAASCLIVAGVSCIIAFFFSIALRELKLGLGVILSIVGIWFLIQPDTLWKIISVVIGAVLLIHGFQNIKMATESKKYADPNWWIGLVFGVINIALAFVCIFNLFNPVKFILQIMGIALIYGGLSGLIMVVRVNGAARKVKQQTDIIDTEAQVRDAD